MGFLNVTGPDSSHYHESLRGHGDAQKNVSTVFHTLLSQRSVVVLSSGTTVSGAFVT